MKFIRKNGEYFVLISIIGFDLFIVYLIFSPYSDLSLKEAKETLDNLITMNVFAYISLIIYMVTKKYINK